ncbi:MAG: hypothetical protein IJP03_04265 [Christensenellaceae bacterium]|nr:hypothetical protein [Christensenellaceae bacterium]
MVTCKCGCEFDNSYGDNFVMCPQCKKIYANTAPNLFHPVSEDELNWNCSACGAENSNSYAGAWRRFCEKCGAPRAES